MSLLPRWLLQPVNHKGTESWVNKHPGDPGSALRLAHCQNSLSDSDPLLDCKKTLESTRVRPSQHLHDRKPFSTPPTMGQRVSPTQERQRSTPDRFGWPQMCGIRSKTSLWRSPLRHNATTRTESSVSGPLELIATKPARFGENGSLQQHSSRWWE